MDHCPLRHRKTSERLGYDVDQDRNPVCDGSSWLWGDEDNSQRPCACREARIMDARLSGLATNVKQLPRYRTTELTRKPVIDLPPEVLRPIQRYAANLAAEIAAGNGMWLAGPTGNGKTSVAVALAKHAWRTPTAERAGRGRRPAHTVALHSVPKLLRLIASTFDDAAARAERSARWDIAADDYAVIAHKLETVDLLVLDDLGTERSTEWAIEELYTLVDARLVAERPIIVTTNYTELELRAQLGDRIVGRLLQTCGKPLEFTGHDWRSAHARDHAAEASGEIVHLDRQRRSEAS